MEVHRILFDGQSPEDRAAIEGDIKQREALKREQENLRREADRALVELVPHFRALAVPHAQSELPTEPTGPIKPLPRNVGNRYSVQRMDAYLQKRGIGLQELAVRSGIAERTLRNFRKNATMRRVLFHVLAKTIGCTPEELLTPAE